MMIASIFCAFGKFAVTHIKIRNKFKLNANKVASNKFLCKNKTKLFYFSSYSQSSMVMKMLIKTTWRIIWQKQYLVWTYSLENMHSIVEGNKMTGDWMVIKTVI